jgi:drug/metabolite transporter (DMT)-like permease
VRIERHLSDSTKPRRWTVIASGLLCGILALVVLFTDRGAFSSPLAVVVVAAIGMAAVLLQLRMRNKDQSPVVRSPVWLNLVGIVSALVALFSDMLHLSSGATQIAALGAVGSFGISSAVILHSFRKQRAAK